MHLKLCKSAAKLFFFVYAIDETLMINVLCGILSGVISSSIANPTDVLKVIMCYVEFVFIFYPFLEEMQNLLMNIGFVFLTLFIHIS